VNGDHELTTLRELLRDALEIARSAGAASTDAEMTALWKRSREGLMMMLGDLDDFATRRGNGPAS